MTRTLALVGLSVLLAAGIGCGRMDSERNTIAGKMTLNGQPIQSATVFVTGPDDAVASGPVSGGNYTIRRAPVGPLRFRVVSVPPPPPGSRIKLKTDTGASIPERYQSSDNELSLDYKGGKQIFDIALQP
jgi:hypothetical protein